MRSRISLLDPGLHTETGSTSGSDPLVLVCPSQSQQRVRERWGNLGLVGRMLSRSCRDGLSSSWSPDVFPFWSGSHSWKKHGVLHADRELCQVIIRFPVENLHQVQDPDRNMENRARSVPGPISSSALSLFPAELIMPIDMALPLYLSKEEFVYRASPNTCKPALSSCLRFQRCVDQTEPEGGPPSRRDSGKAKKQVTFADHRGLALTRVKVFSQFNDPIDIPVNVQQMFSSAASPAAEEDRLELDFTQPSSDYLLFRQSLERNLVCLEHCVLREKALAGTIKVKNVSFQKSVKLRVTFDTWKSHMDVDCVYVKDTYPSSYSDTFSFHVCLPDELRPHERVEFAVCYEVDGCEYWDSNQGDNYRIVWSSVRRSRQDAGRLDSFSFGIHFDRYGSPTCSHGIFPDWPSYAGYENAGPYY